MCSGLLYRSVEVSLPSLLLVLAWVTFLLLYDEIFPAQVTGKDREGNEITLQVCSAPVKFEQIYRNNVNAVSRKTYLLPTIIFIYQIIEPRLDPCVTYYSAKGLDRLVVLLEWDIRLFVMPSKFFLYSRMYFYI